jgi:hypothetical protein
MLFISSWPVKMTNHSPIADRQTEQADLSPSRWELASAIQRRNKLTNYSPNAGGQTDQADQSTSRWELGLANQHRNKPTNHSPESDRPQPITVELQPMTVCLVRFGRVRQLISLVKEHGGSLQAGVVTNFE